MTLPDLAELTYEGGDYADPEKTTALVRILQNGQSAGVAKSLVVVSRPALVFGFTVSSIAAQFIQLFDAGSLPADTAVPTLVFPVAATSTIANQWIPARAFRNGVVICNSSTQHTKTLGATADCIFDVQYI